MNDIILNSFQKAWVPFFSGSIPEWIESNIELKPPRFSITGPVDLKRSKYLIQPLLSLGDKTIKQCNIMGPVQSGKSLISSLWATYLISNSEGTMLRLTQTEDMAHRMFETEFMPIMQSNGIIDKYMPLSTRRFITRNDIYFPHFNIHIDSAKESVLQSLTVKYLTLDECFLMENGFIFQAKNRTEAFPYNRKILLTSVAGNDVDEWTDEFNRGIVHEWAWRCAKCNTQQLYTWFKKDESGAKSGLIYDEVVVEGRTNIVQSAATARMVCGTCKEVYPNTTGTRRKLNDGGEYIITKSDGDNKTHSFRWNALANIDVGYDVLAGEYLEARAALHWEGDKTKLSNFYRMKLAVPWATKHTVSIADVMAADYNPADEWGDLTFMCVDCQQNFSEFWYVIRSWKKSGESRLKAWGRSLDFESLRKVQAEYKIRDNNVLIDSGYNATTVYAKCCEFSHTGVVGGKKITLGWIALKGADQTDFVHSDNTRKLYSPMVRGDPNLGKGKISVTCPLYRWSNVSIQDILVYLRDGKGISYLIPESLKSEEYVRQMNAHYKTFVMDKRTNKPKPFYACRPGVADHLWDCESMQIVAAYMSGCLGSAIIAK